MATLALVLIFLALGVGVIFVAYSGGLGAARQAYLTGGGTFFKIAIPVLYIAFGIAIPAIIISNGEAKEGSSGALANKVPSGQLEQGKQLFQGTCATCHSLKAVNAQGVQGPNLDAVGKLTQKRVLDAIHNGGTGERLMPADLLQGKSAEAVAAYVAQVAGR